ncbi:MAG: hypothetical protein V4503_07310, partial [Gemmatimonadota bacterium]
ARGCRADVLGQVLESRHHHLGEPRDAEEQCELLISMLVRGLPNPDSAQRPTLPTIRAATRPAPGNTGEHPIPGKVRVVTLKRPGAD